MSWDSYISNLTKSEWVDDAAILGLTPGQESVWASAPGGWLSQVTVQHLQTKCYFYSLVSFDYDLFIYLRTYLFECH